MRYALVYQCGIANVFRLSVGRPERLYQGGYLDSLAFARGIKATGADVATCHCEQAGDVAGFPWNDGPGYLWEGQRIEA